MTVFVNNTPINLTTVATLHQVLEQQHLYVLRGIAVAVNNNVIPKAEWQQKVLANNDKITIIRATQGG